MPMLIQELNFNKNMQFTCHLTSFYKNQLEILRLSPFLRWPPFGHNNVLKYIPISRLICQYDITSMIMSFSSTIRVQKYIYINRL